MNIEGLEIYLALSTILIVSVGLSFLSKLKFSTFLNPVIIILVWWFGWLIVANLSLTGMPAPSLHLQFLIILMISSYSIGCFIVNRFPRKNAKDYVSSDLFLKRFAPLLGWTLFILFILMIPLMSAFAQLSMSGQLDEDVSGLRVKVFDDTFLFGDPRIGFLYRFLVYPLLFFVTILSSLYLVSGNPIFFYASSIIFIIRAICTFGRAEIFYLFYFLVISYLIRAIKIDRIINSLKLLFTQVIRAITISNKKVLRKIIVLSVIIILFSSSLSYLTSKRESTSNLNSETSSSLLSGDLESFVDYNTLGFRLMDLELTDSSSYLNQNLFFGQASFGGLEFVVKNFLRLDNITQHYKMSLLQQENWVEVSPGKRYNAYYTVLYSLYIDGRYIFVVMLPLFFGMITSWVYQGWINNGKLTDLFYSILIVDSLIISIYKDFVCSHIFVMIVLISYIFFGLRNKVSRRMIRA